MNIHVVMLGLILLFALFHSGLAAMRSFMESKIGARLYRVLFALVSITLAVPMFIYYFNHCYEGVLLWQVQTVPGVHTFVLLLSGIAFLFLYPATFNLAEIAAIAKPEIHLYETGIIRICRHSQWVGMTLWCIAHTLWIGTSFALVTALGLIGYHLFGVWHGDRRWESRYGEAFLALKQRTSIIPFLAIAQGKQTLVWQEFLRPAYIGVLATIVIFRWLHPIVIGAARSFPWI